MRIDDGLVEPPTVLSARLGRSGVARVQSCAKAAVWRIVAVLPCRLWPRVSAAVQRVIPGIRHA